MKLAPKKREESSATLAPTLWVVAGFSLIFALAASASDPSWWSSRGAVHAPVVTTNDGIVTTNYVTNAYAVVTQGQLKQFTARAVDELNADLPGGAGTNLNTLASNWAQDYLTNGYATNTANPTRPYKPSDFQAETVGQLKYIGNMVWSRLVSANYTNTAPSWLGDTNANAALANLGQLKTVFDFDLSTWNPPGGSIPVITSPATVTTAVNATFSYAITATNTPTGFSATGLPSRLTVNGAGVISGTPGAAGIYSVNLSAANASGTGTGVLVIDVTSSSTAPVINSPAAEVASVGTAVAYQITASNNPTQFGATGLPAGLSINSATGVISGAVSTAGTYTINLSANNGAGTGTKVLTLAVNSGAQSGNALPVITSSLSASATVGQSFTYTITASNTPFSYGAIGLPTELNIVPATGVISGTPATPGTSIILISATNANGTETAALTITVAPALSSVTSSLSLNAVVETFFDYVPTVTNNPTGFSIVSGELPSGLSINSSTGEIYGTPESSGSNSVTISITNAAGSANATFTITVDTAHPVIQGPFTDSATIGSFYNYAISATNTPTSFNVTGLPAGLVFNPLTGVISGTPTIPGTYAINLQATNALGTGSATLTLTVVSNNPGSPQITSPAIAYVTVSSAINYTITAINSPASFGISGNPSWLTCNTSTGVLSGTPTSVGTYLVTLSATNAANNTGTAQLLVVAEATTQSVTATTQLQAAVSPTSNYQTTSATIENDSGNSDSVNTSLPGLTMGNTSSTAVERGLLGFDVSMLPRDSAISNVSLQLNKLSDSANSSSVELDALAAPFSPQTACWTLDNGLSTALSSVEVNPSDTTDTWPLSTNFISAVHSAITNAAPLDMALKVPITVENNPGGTPYYYTFSNETDSTASNHPLLSITYKTGAPPVILPAALVLPVSTAFTYTVPVLDGSVTWTSSSISPAASGVSVSNGVVSGTTPSTAGLYTVTLNATNANGPGSGTLVLNVGNLPAITSSLTASGSIDAAFNYTITASNGATTYNATGLPAGLSINSQTGVISGTIADWQTTGTIHVTISATNTYGTTTATLTVYVALIPPVISGTPLTVSVNQGVSFSFYVSATGQPFSFSTSTLPSWLTFTNNDTFGIFAGTPPSTGAATVTTVYVTASNTAGSGASVPVTITATPLPAPTVPTQWPTVGSVSSTFYYSPEYTLNQAQSSNSPSLTGFSATLASGSSSGLNLNWLSIDQSTGEMTGTPTAPGTYVIDLTATDSGGTSQVGTLTLTVFPAGPEITSPLADVVYLGVPYTNTAPAYAPSAYDPATSSPATINSVTGLPAGLNYNATDGYVEGTPTSIPTGGTASVTISATNSSNQTNTATLALMVEPDPIDTPLTGTAYVGTSYYYTLMTLCSSATVTSATGLPPGLIYTDYKTYGVISGTPTSEGTFNVALTATDGAYPSSTATLVLTVSGITSSPTATATVESPFTYTITAANNPTSFSVPNLPSTWSLNQSTGQITGTPLTADFMSLNLIASAADGTSTTGTLLLTIAPLSSDSTFNFQAGVSPTSAYTEPTVSIANDSADPSQANQTFNTGTVFPVGLTTATKSQRGLLAFDLSALPAGANITSASLVLTTVSGSSAGGPVQIEVHPTNAPFDSTTATWANNSSYGSLFSWMTLNPSATPGAITFPGTATFAQAVQQAYSNTGVIYLTVAAPNAESGTVPDYIGFATRATEPTQNPKLVVTYTLGNPPLAPVITSSTLATGNVGVPFSYTITATQSPSSFSATPIAPATTLPAGLSLNSAGVISGTPSQVGSTSVTVGAHNVIGTGTQPVTINIDSATPATGLQVITGNNQTGAPGTFLAQPLVIQANYNNAGLPNALVTLSVPSGEGAFSLTNTGTPTANTLTLVTNGSGQATAYFLLPPSLGTTTILATSGTAQPISLVETSSLSTDSGDSLIVLSVLSGEGQGGPAGATLPEPFVIQATNALGQPVGSQSLALSLVPGCSGSISSSANGTFSSTLTVSTNASGQATVYMQPGGSDGATDQFTCTASSGSSNTVYLTALTSSTSSSSPTPGGGTPPTADPGPDPTTSLDGEQISLSVSPDSNDPTVADLEWTNDPAAVSYIVERYDGDNASLGWVQIPRNGAHDYDDPNRLGNVRYQYRVIAVDAQGNQSPPSNIVSYALPLIKTLWEQYGGSEAYYVDPPRDYQYPPGDWLSYNTFDYYWDYWAEWGYGDFFNFGWAGYSSDSLGDFSYSNFNFKYTAFPCSSQTLRWYVMLYPYNNDSGVWGNPVVYKTEEWTTSGGDSPVYNVNAEEYQQNGDYFISLAEQIDAFDSTSSDGTYPDEAPLDPAEKNTTGGVISQGASGNFQISDIGISGAQYDISVAQSGGGFIVADSQGSIGGNLTLTADQLSDLGDYFTVSADPSSPPANGATVTITVQVTDSAGDSMGTDTVKYTYSGTPSSSNLTVPLDEASGPKYRKIALNGLPMADEKPQQTAETDQEKEETYIDALTVGLRHSTTDVYMPVSGSDFTVSARRDFRSQVWNNRSGLLPHEQPDLPFGMCWSSNLAANIKIVTNADPLKTEPDQAVVTDETGAVHPFFIWYDGSGTEKFFPMPTSKNEQQTPYLESLTVNNSTNPPTYTFTRKYGATLTYQGTALNLKISNDRVLGSPYSTTNSYARLIQATDRLGNTVNYQYQGTTNLVPETITVANQPGIKLSIEQQPISALISGSSNPQSVVTAIWDANGNKTSYTYASASGDSDAAVLTSVTTPDGATTQYTYSSQSELDQMPHAASDPRSTYWYADIASIEDPLHQTYLFWYALDHSKFGYMDNPQVHVGNYIQSGSPRTVTTVTLPNLATTTFDNSGSQVAVSPGQNGAVTMTGQRLVKVTDATKNFTRTYNFGNATVLTLPKFRTLYASSSISVPVVIVYQNESIAYGDSTNYLGTETFNFNINAGMALSQITDLSGNVTSFAQADQWNASTITNAADLQAYNDYQQVVQNMLVNGQPFNGYYSDPTSQIDALGQTKTFTYATDARIMKSIIDEAGRKTVYQIDGLGRRTSESICPAGSSTPIQETEFQYGSSAYPGFMTKKTVDNLDNIGSWENSLVTQYVPDANGRVAQEIVDPGRLNLVTTYTYDPNGNKLTATDPKGHTTWFSYDSRNQLITTTFADGTQKQFVYDARGNKIKEYDEKGIATLYAYDALSRLVTQARDMNGDGVINSGDLITSYTYNNVNSKLTVTDPNGKVTTMAYDNLQRVTSITDALSNVTQFTYGANSGGNAFDSSSFKPTHTVDPRGFTTDVSYDALYRPLTKAVLYQQGAAPSTTSTQYDAVGNPTMVTDPLGHQTSTTYDALNRPLLTTYADGSTAQASYTSTGFKWQVEQQVSGSGSGAVFEIATSQYDNAGRVVAVTNTGSASGSPSSTTTTSYDAADNVAETVNPLGFKWDYVYDARNRKLQEIEPQVTDAISGTASRPILSWQYDPAGNVTAAIDARGNETDTVYDPANRVTDVNAPAVPVNGGSSSRPNTHTTYDLNGNVLTLRDANSHTTTNAYDALNRLLTTTDVLSITVTNTYDQVGNKLTVKDGNHNTTSFTYDGLNRLLTTTDAAGGATQLRYDALNKTQRIDALGQTTTYLYDVRNRLSNVVYASSAAANSQRNYAYDDVGNLLSVTEPSKTAANVVYVYDPLNRDVHETSNGQTHTYTYDAAGNRLTTTYGGTGRSITSTYDALNRLSTMQDQTAAELAANSPGRTTTYGYDLDGNITKKTLPNGDKEIAVFDALNRMSSQTDTTGGNAALYAYTYDYDLAGNLTADIESYPSGLNNRTVTNTYDAIDRLLAEAVTGSAPNATTAYTYDAANNRLTKAVTGAGADTTTYTYNSLNQPTGYSDTTGRSVALTYDLNGNRTVRTVSGGSDNGTDTYSYDFENRLITLVKATNGGVGTYAYTYDYRTRRIVRDESSAGGVVTNLVFSGGTSVQEYTGTISSGDLAVEYLRGSDYGGGVGGILYTIRSGTPSYTHENRRGDVVAKTSGNGSLTYQAQYQAFGQQTQTSGSTLDRQKSNSKDTDPTGLVDEGFRYRDLETGMFINRDPAGFVDGPNEYTYVRQNPWTHFDPEGLQEGEADPVPEEGKEDVDAEGRPLPESQVPAYQGPGEEMQSSDPSPETQPTLEEQEKEVANEAKMQDDILKGNISLSPGTTSEKQESNENEQKTGSSTPPTPQKPADDQIKDIGPIKGQTQEEIEAKLKAEGYTPVRAKNGGTIWTKPGSDGKTSAVRVDPPNPNAPAGNADSVEHAHKETVPTDKVEGGNYKPKDAQTYDDSGNPTGSKDYAANHIPTTPSQPSTPVPSSPPSGSQSPPNSNP